MVEKFPIAAEIIPSNPQLVIFTIINRRGVEEKGLLS